MANMNEAGAVNVRVADTAGGSAPRRGAGMTAGDAAARGRMAGGCATDSATSKSICRHLNAPERDGRAEDDYLRHLDIPHGALLVFG
jgi:hypothetical protein